ncbi:MAG: hypothetical protein AB7G23_15505 [Vicinamibacterales bacterium]
MLPIIAALVVLAAVALAPRLLGRGRARAPDLGGVSEQWLAAHRASHEP